MQNGDKILPLMKYLIYIYISGVQYTNFGNRTIDKTCVIMDEDGILETVDCDNSYRVMCQNGRDMEPFRASQNKCYFL